MIESILLKHTKSQIFGLMVDKIIIVYSLQNVRLQIFSNSNNCDKFKFKTFE